MTTIIYPSIKEVLEKIKDEKPPNILPIIDDDESYEWIDFGDKDGGRILPSMNSKFYTSFLFRGQNKRFTPCLTSLYRPLDRTVSNQSEVSEDLQNRFIMYQMKSAEFKHSIEHHPSIIFSREIGLHVSGEALAQHYGIPTDLLDMTQSPEVAAFFATCNLNDKKGWIPVSDGIGVIYKFDFTIFSRTLGESDYNDKEFFKKVELIGLQTLPRPGEQKAWTIKLPPSIDFEKFPLNMYLFKQSKKESEKILEIFNNGNKLFPYDIAYELASKILKSKIIPKSIAEKVMLSQRCDPDKLESAVNYYDNKFNTQHGIRIEDSLPLTFSSAQLIKAQRFVDEQKSSFLSKVGVRPIKIDETNTKFKE